MIGRFAGFFACLSPILLIVAAMAAKLSPNVSGHAYVDGREVHYSVYSQHVYVQVTHGFAQQYRLTRRGYEITRVSIIIKSGGAMLTYTPASTSEQELFEQLIG